MKTSTIVLLAALAGGLPALAQTAETPPPPQRGTPGVASSRGVVKVSDLADLTTGPRNADGAGGAGGAAPAAPPPEGASPAPAQSFLGTLYDPAVPDAIRAYPMGAVGPHHQVTGVYGKMLIRDRAGTLLRTV